MGFKMALMWGVLGVAFIRLVFPALSRALARLRGNGARVLCAVMSVFMAANLLVTSAAIVRWRDRGAGIAAGLLRAAYRSGKAQGARIFARPLRFYNGSIQ